MRKLFYLPLLLIFCACQKDNNLLYKEVIDKPQLDISNYADFISEKVEENIIKSIKVYKYFDGEIYFKSKDSIKVGNKSLFYFLSLQYNKKGQLVNCRQKYESDIPEETEYIYNYNGQIISQKFNGQPFMIYHYNEHGDLSQEINLTDRGNSIGRYSKHETSYNQNEIIRTEYTYSSDTLLSSKWMDSIIIKKDELIKTTYRMIPDEDTTQRFMSRKVYRLCNDKLLISSDSSVYGYLYNASKKKEYRYTFHPNGKIKSIISGTDTTGFESTIFNSNGDKVLEKDSYTRKVFQYQYDTRGNWTVRKYYINGKLNEIFKRNIEYYSSDNDQDIPAYQLPASIIKKADSLCKYIPNYAIKNQAKIDKRKKDLATGNYGKSIEKLKGKSLEEFLPKYWTFIGSDTGCLFPYKSKVVIATYNTPIPSADKSGSLRCLAIFENLNGVLYLREQHTNVIDYNPEGCNVSINDNMIEIGYGYRNGEETIKYEYDLSAKDWRITYLYSSSRTYDSWSSDEYDYKKGKVHLYSSTMNADGTEDETNKTVYLKQLKNKKILLKNLKVDEDFQNDTITVKGYGEIHY